MRLLHGPGTYAALNDTQQFVDEMNATALNAGGGFANYADWRLPNIKELISIVERKCIRPALNTAVFPAVHFDKFWTSSTYEQLTEAAYVEFIYGNNNSSFKDREWQVRLVR